MQQDARVRDRKVQVRLEEPREIVFLRVRPMIPIENQIHDWSALVEAEHAIKHH